MKKKLTLKQYFKLLDTDYKRVWEVLADHAKKEVENNENNN